MTVEPVIVPVIMSGGAGTRLWPLSTREKPKQLHALASKLTLLQETVLRCPQTKGFAPPMIVCAKRHATQVQKQCEAVNTAPTAVITEPCPRNTAPCAVMAALAVREQYGDAAQILLLAADHHIADPNAFITAIKAGADTAAQKHIVTFGAKPTEPATGYGYIQRGAAIDEAAFHVSTFVEKPDLATAKSYLKDGNYLWNAGIFLFRTDVLLDEMNAHREDILNAASRAWEKADRSGNYIHLPQEAFSACPSESLDYAVMENTNKAAMVPLSAGWSDVGAWPAIYDLLSKDANENACHGRVATKATNNCLLYADGPMVAAYGIENMAVIATDKSVLVLPLEQAQNIKSLIEILDEDER